MSSFAERGGWWVVAQVTLFGVAFALGLVGPRWPSEDGFAIAGAVVLVAGLAMIVAGIASLGSAATPYPKPTPATVVRDSGIYRWVRHPIYGGGILLLVGWGLFARPLGLAGALLMGLFFELKSAREERWLIEHDPAYEAYRSRVRWKFMPGVR